MFPLKLQPPTVQTPQSTPSSKPQIPTNGACSNYSWDAQNAVGKAIKLMNPTPYNLNDPAHFNPQKDAYRNCKNCHKHKNYHGK